MTKLPSEFRFLHVYSDEIYSAKLVGYETYYVVSWEHGTNVGSTTYPIREVEENIADGTWKIVHEISKEQDVSGLPYVVFAKVIIPIELESGTFLQCGEEVTIIASIECEAFYSGLGYVVLSEKHVECATVDSSMVHIDMDLYGKRTVLVCELPWEEGTN
jgi:hypothetical protein